MGWQTPYAIYRGRRPELVDWLSIIGIVAWAIVFMWGS